MDQAILEKEALKLAPVERALLAEALLSSLDDEQSRQIDAAWGTLAEERYSDYKAGKTAAEDGPAVLQDLRKRHAK